MRRLLITAKIGKTLRRDIPDAAVGSGEAFQGAVRSIVERLTREENLVVLVEDNVVNVLDLDMATNTQVHVGKLGQRGDLVALVPLAARYLTIPDENPPNVRSRHAVSVG